MRCCPNCLSDHDIPTMHDHRLFLRRDLATGKPKEVVIWAVWMGGWKELLTWPWDADGLKYAQEWCDTYGAIWMDGHHSIQRDTLAVYANAV